jgi:hypothetical protein
MVKQTDTSIANRQNPRRIAMNESNESSNQVDPLDGFLRLLRQHRGLIRNTFPLSDEDWLNEAAPHVCAEYFRQQDERAYSMIRTGLEHLLSLDGEREDTRVISKAPDAGLSPIGVFKTMSDFVNTISDIGKRLGASGAIEFSLAWLNRIASRLSDKEAAKAAFRGRLAELSTLDPKTWYGVALEIEHELGSSNLSLADLIEDYIRSKFDFVRLAVREMYSSLSASERRTLYYVFDNVTKLPSINRITIESMVCPSDIAINSFELAKLKACEIWAIDEAVLRRKLID